MMNMFMKILMMKKKKVKPQNILATMEDNHLEDNLKIKLRKNPLHKVKKRVKTDTAQQLFLSKYKM